MKTSRQWYAVVDGKGMRMITEKAITQAKAREAADMRFGSDRVAVVRPADPGEFRRPH